jgi:hypothetical protein
MSEPSRIVYWDHQLTQATSIAGGKSGKALSIDEADVFGHSRLCSQFATDRGISI